MLPVFAVQRTAEPVEVGDDDVGAAEFGVGHVVIVERERQRAVSVPACWLKVFTTTLVI